MQKTCRILVVSDSHGRNQYLKAVIEKEKPFDMLIHCGDVEGNLYSIVGTDPGFDVHVVRGNCDYSGYSDMTLVEVSGKRILVTHGHLCRIRTGTEGLLREAVRHRADIVCYGHSHVPDITYSHGRLLLNPGSIAEPRQMPRKRTYAILTIAAGKEPRADICVLEPCDLDQ